MLRRYVSPEFAGFRRLLLRKVLIARDQVNLHREIVHICHEKLPLRVERSTAPIHAPKIAGKGDNPRNAWRSEDSARSQTRESLPARGSVGIRCAPNILSGDLLPRKRRWSGREWLRWRRFFFVSVALRNRPFLHREHRNTGFAVKNK